MLRRPCDQLLILASDGLWDVMSSQEACDAALAALARAKAAGRSRNACVRMAAVALSNEALSRGSHDNVSVVIADLRVGALLGGGGAGGAVTAAAAGDSEPMLLTAAAAEREGARAAGVVAATAMSAPDVASMMAELAAGRARPGAANAVAASPGGGGGEEAAEGAPGRALPPPLGARGVMPPAMFSALQALRAQQTAGIGAAAKQPEGASPLPGPMPFPTSAHVPRAPPASVNSNVSQGGAVVSPFDGFIDVPAPQGGAASRRVGPAAGLSAIPSSGSGGLLSSGSGHQHHGGGGGGGAIAFVRDFSSRGSSASNTCAHPGDPHQQQPRLLSSAGGLTAVYVPPPPSVVTPLGSQSAVTAGAAGAIDSPWLAPGSGGGHLAAAPAHVGGAAAAPGGHAALQRFIQQQDLMRKQLPLHRAMADPSSAAALPGGSLLPAPASPATPAAAHAATAAALLQALTSAPGGRPPSNHRVSIFPLAAPVGELEPLPPSSSSRGPSSRRSTQTGSHAAGAGRSPSGSAIAVVATPGLPGGVAPATAAAAAASHPQQQQQRLRLSQPGSAAAAADASGAGPSGQHALQLCGSLGVGAAAATRFAVASTTPVGSQLGDGAAGTTADGCGGAAGVETGVAVGPGVEEEDGRSTGDSFDAPGSFDLTD